MCKAIESLPELISPKQLAQITGEHINTVRRGIAEGRIPADKVNGRWFICRDLVFANAIEFDRRAGGEGRG